MASPEGRALRRILVDLDSRAVLLGLAGPKGAKLRSVASQALAGHLKNFKASKSKPTSKPKGKPNRKAGYEARQLEREKQALRVAA